MKHMSIFSDHNCGALSDAEFANECASMNRLERVAELKAQRLNDEEDCWENGTGCGDCNLCDHCWECSGSTVKDD